MGYWIDAGERSALEIGAAAFVLATLNAASGAMTPAMEWNTNSLGANMHFTKPLPGEMEMIAAAGVG